nr:unnamed protein product [Callosobruchus analis]
MVKHPDIAGDCIINRCSYYNKTFTSKSSVKKHIVKKHPDFVAWISSKIHESNRMYSMAKHPEIADNHITNRCIDCSKSFTHKLALEDHIVKKHPDFIASVSGKVHECTKCAYKTVSTNYLKRHMVKHPDIVDYRITNRCVYCNKTFTNKPSLDDHVLKTHPDFIASVSSKVHECTECTYKTTSNGNFKRHMVKHLDVARNHITICIYCNKTFTSKQALDGHIIKTHPDFIASVSSKVHGCTECTYRTTSNSNLKRHMDTHPDIAGNHVFRCIYCKNTLTCKKVLDDHIVKKHPDFIASISSKVHECTKCSFKTVHPSRLKKHIKVKHPDIDGNHITNRCIYCNKTFTSKQALDGHIIKTHPDFIASVTSKVHECTECTYKTTSNGNLRGHMAKHPDAAHNYITNRCIYCSKTFTSTQSLDDHIIKTHPDFIASVSRKVHECTECTYKSTSNGNLKRHMVKHLNAAGNHTTARCIYCNITFVQKQTLDDHIVKTHPDFIASVNTKIHECQLRRHMVKHPDIAGNYTTIRCSYCNKTFESKRSLDNHIVKRHPDFVASVSSKIHGCTQCTYRTTISRCLKEHLMKHPEIAGNRIFRCIYCNKTFTRKLALDDHIVKKHSDFIACISNKVHGCTKCTYKTTSNSHLKRHMVKHSDIAGDHITNRCTHCNKTFTSTQALDDHIVKRHPDFIASVSRKVHECTECTYKTVFSSQLRRHMAKHPNIADDRITKCIYCDKTLTSKPSLDDHIVKRHPDFIASVGRKVHECTKCTFKTVFTSQLRNHMVKHPDIGSNRITNKCIHCNKTFTSKQAVDDHIIKTHPDFTASVSSKVHECTECTYKTTSNSHLKRHMAKHTDIAGI